ncbi:MAG TPA: metallophosphoesterase family protein [Burkholderiales bacterium]|nr:metallophosphoesterase family protein [Burkholderiales bacterium]
MARTPPGRSCPRHYRYSPAVFARAADLKARSLYIVGGLYGNSFALEAVLAMARREGATLVFNGDFNWFDVDPAEFEGVNETVLEHLALRGNVETEIAGEDSGAGCGCAYPEWVGDAEVERSNEILRRLRGTASAYPELRERLAALPMHLVAEIGGLRIGIVHGDAESLAGWQFSQEALRERPERTGALLAGAAIDVFACTHTCLPVMQDFATPRGTALVVNNGAAGMPNFRDTHFGLATRIAGTPSPQALYGARLGATVVEAVPVRYDYEAWMARFDRVWPAGSPASLSYRKRIASGPGYEVGQAVRTGARTGAFSRAA